MVQNHVHTIRRLDENHVKCNDPYCSFVTEPILVEGKASLCNLCGAEFILTHGDIKRYAIPRCINCKTSKQAKEFQERKNLLSDILMKPISELDNQNGDEREESDDNS